MSDYSELKAAAINLLGSTGTSNFRAAVNKFAVMCTPLAVRNLIDENETLTKIFADAPDLPDTDVEWLEKTRLLEAECDQLRAEVDGLRTGYEAYERVNAELKAECEALRKDLRNWQEVVDAVKREAADRFTHTSHGNAPGHCHSISGVWDGDNGALAGKECAWCKTWNAAMGKGDRP